MIDKFILKDREAVPADLMTWATWFETADRAVAKTQVGDFRVSTVFLGIDHNFGDGPPLIFETMVFDRDGGDVWMERWSTWAQAELGHMEAVERVERGEL